jgi:hypothetical protein
MPLTLPVVDPIVGPIVIAKIANANRILIVFLYFGMLHIVDQIVDPLRVDTIMEPLFGSRFGPQFGPLLD